MSRKLLVYLCLVALAVSSAPMLIGEPESKPDQNDKLAGFSGSLTTKLAEPRQAGQADRGGATRGQPIKISYDDGVVTAVPAATSFCFGNQFDSVSGNPVGSFSVTVLKFYLVAGAGTDGVFLSVFGPVNGTTASVLGSGSFGPNVSGAWNSFAVGPYSGVGSFLAGVWYVAGDTVGLGSGTVNGQGLHGMVINDIVGTGFTTIPLNAMVRAQTQFIPVELMDFKVTDE